jgi:CheY-like chemotaxis protein
MTNQILQTVEDLLQFAIPGIEVVSANNGLEALGLLRRGTFDAVLTDYRMPGMDGSELVQAIRTQWPMLRIAMFTAYVDQGLLKKLQEILPGLDIIAKPVEVDEFVPRIRQLVQPGQPA